MSVTKLFSKSLEKVATLHIFGSLDHRIADHWFIYLNIPRKAHVISVDFMRDR